jgi:hypothetical protein
MLMDLVRNAGCDASSPFDLQSKVQERLTCRSRPWVRERTACSSDLGYAAIDEDLAGRDEAAIVGGQEGDDLPNLRTFGQGALCLRRMP